MGLPGGSGAKKSPASAVEARDEGSIPGSEEEVATDSSVLVWEIPWTEEPGGLQSTGSHRVLAS